MKALNNKERAKIYWQVLLIYVVTTGLVILIVSFNYALPGALDEVQQKHVKEAEVFMLHKQDVLTYIDSINNNIAYIESASDPEKYNNIAINLTLEFKKFGTSDSTLGNLVTKVGKSFDAYREAELKILKLYDDKKKAEDARDAKQLEIDQIKAASGLH